MDRSSGQKRAVDTFYPPIEPFDRRLLDVGDGHRIHVEQCGNPDGVPVMVFHGGPGGGVSPGMRRFFDPAHYRVVLFDQRGCGRSIPHASVEANTTRHLVADAERIRETLGIGRFIAFGGSWGATLALAHALNHPERVLHLVLRSVFLATRAELDWFYGGGVGRFFPDLWAGFREQIPESEHGDLIAAFHRRLFSGVPADELRHARAWAQWENTLSTIQGSSLVGYGSNDHVRAFARLENHYFINGCFLPEDGWILKNRARIEHVPADIVQGRYDMVCPPHAAWTLAQGWDRARLHMVPLSGHALSEPGISAALVRVMNDLRGHFAPEATRPPVGHPGV